MTMPVYRFVDVIDDSRCVGKYSSLWTTFSKLFKLLDSQKFKDVLADNRMNPKFGFIDAFNRTIADVVEDELGFKVDFTYPIQGSSEPHYIELSMSEDEYLIFCLTFK